jgi:xanthine dehydrogenase accessory factor
MSKALSIWRFLLDHLQQNIPVMLLYVLESKGSSPGRQGFFMGVSQNGEMEGSVGGGVMEHKFIELAKEKLKSSSGELSVRKQIHDKSAKKNQSGMICSGEQTILLYALQKEDSSGLQAIIDCLLQNKNGKLCLSPSGIAFEEQIPGKDFHYHFLSENDWLYEEKLGFKNELFIIGGGHCSLAFARIMSDMDFYIRLYDDRQELNTFEANRFVHEKFIVGDYSELASLIPSGDHHYVVIMSFGYRTDDIAVRALLDKEFAFFGLLGSAAKISKMFAQYRSEGIEEKLLQKIHAPVGLSIHSQTPEEIAISIAAQIIQVKNQKQFELNQSASLYKAVDQKD